jgi:hypothetical protein
MYGRQAKELADNVLDALERERITAAEAFLIAGHIEAAGNRVNRKAFASDYSGGEET